MAGIHTENGASKMITQNAIYLTRENYSAVAGMADDELLEAVAFARSVVGIIENTEEKKNAFSRASRIGMASLGNRAEKRVLYVAICAFELYRVREIKEQNTLRTNNRKGGKLEENCFYNYDMEA